MLEKYRKLQPKPKTTDLLKADLKTIWEELSQEHIDKAVATFIKRLTAYMAVATMMVTSSICSNSVHLQVCILVSSPTNRLFSEPPTDYR